MSIEIVVIGGGFQGFWLREPETTENFQFHAQYDGTAVRKRSWPQSDWEIGLGVAHPTIDDDVDETVIIQGHKIRFKTIDLGLPTAEVLSRLKSISDDWSGMA